MFKIPPLISKRGVQALLAALGVAAAVAGCGGGGVGLGGTGSYTAGSISGFGSVIVNTVRFDDSTAQISDLDGERSRRDDLRLGMTVEVESGAVTVGVDGAGASATRIVVASEMLGAVSAIDRTAGTLTVLGQTVQTGATTVWDGATLQSLAVGRVVEVHAQPDPAGGRYRATRIEVRSGSVAAFRLRGVVTQLDTGARSFRIGNAAFAYAGATGVPATLANGSFVRLTLATVPDGAGRWLVQAFGAGERRPPDADGARIKGIVTAFTSSAAFSVNGVPVNAGEAVFPDGSAGVVAGARVEVQGNVRDGVMRATRVSIEDDARETERGFELRGAISAADPAARSFVVRGITVSWAGSGVRFEDGTSTDLVIGRNVEVKGLLSADGTRLEATRIEFK